MGVVVAIRERRGIYSGGCKSMRGSGVTAILVWILKHRDKSMSVGIISQVRPFDIPTCIMRRVEGCILETKSSKGNDRIKKGGKSNLDKSTVKVGSTTIFIAHFGDARGTLRIPKS